VCCCETAGLTCFADWRGIPSPQRRPAARKLRQVWQGGRGAAERIRYGHNMHIRLEQADKVAEDPSEFFTMIFGGEAFVDWYVFLGRKKRPASVREHG
jgi:hypothetical protein